MVKNLPNHVERVRIFAIMLVLVVCSFSASAQNYRKFWNFTKWSAETVSNLKAANAAANGGAANTREWSDVEKSGDTTPTDISKDNCFWEWGQQGSTTEDKFLVANGSIISELEGLYYTETDGGGLAIAVNYPATSLGTYNGPSYLWLGGSGKNYFVIPHVAAGTEIKIGVESHKSTDARGIELYVGRDSYGTKLLDPDGNEVAIPTTYQDLVWYLPEDVTDTPNEDGTYDITIRNTNGCHLYYITVVDGDKALESDDINAAILTEGSIPVKWTNDKEHPWYIEGTGNNAYIRTPENSSIFAFTTTLSFTYSSEYPTEISGELHKNNSYYSGEDIKVVIDGEEKISGVRSNWEKFIIMIPAGSHSVEFVSTSSTYYYPGEDYYEGLRNLRVLECKELESACLKEGSLPIHFENDPENMWITENGYIRSTIENLSNATTKISTTFDIDKTSVFSFEFLMGYRSTGWSIANIYVDDVQYKTTDYWNFSDEEWQYVSLALYPGTHKVEIEYFTDYASSKRWMRLRNVYLGQTWYNATLNNPGELGVRLLQALGDKNLQDAELVKIKGTLNSDDWAVVRQLSGAKAIDFTETDITSVPNEGFKDLPVLSTVMLPNTVKEIGNDAFKGPNFRKITIPASVERIGHDVWAETPVQYIDFEQNSNLKTIGYAAFYKTKLIEFIMPNSVTNLERYGDKQGWGWSEGSYDESYLFYQSTSLKKLHLSDGLKTVPRSMASGCSSLSEVKLPANAETIGSNAFFQTALTSIELPESLTSIGSQAFYESDIESVIIPQNVTKLGGNIFYNCKKLKHIELNSHCREMDHTFRGCSSLETIVLPCATPPSIKYDPFADVTKSNVTLYVPDFALEAYKADPYWYKFTNTRISDEASVRDYWAIRGSLTLNDAHKMQGTPSVEVMTGGKLSIDTNTQQYFNEFTFNTSESSPGCFLNNSNSLKANKIVTAFNVAEKNKWYFFSPVADVKMSDVTYPSTDSWVIRYYDGARRASQDASSGNWVNVPADGTLHRGQGYIIQALEPGWLNMPVAVTEHDKILGANEVTLTLEDNPCATAANAGWNFVANPYPTYFDIYYIDMQAPVTVWTGSTYRAYSLNDGDRGDDTFVLRPMQPYFVQKASQELAARMPLHGRRTSSIIDRSRSRAYDDASSSATRQKLNLELSLADSEEADDYTRIVINEQASTEYETVRDASKFMSLDTNVAQIYSLGEKNHPMAINERPAADGVINLGVYLPKAGASYRIKAPRTDRRAWLYDAECGTECELTTGEYVFNASQTGNDISRFSIRLTPGMAGIENTDAVVTKVTGNTGSITVLAAEGADVTVYTADGRTVARATAADGNAEIPAAAGIYIVKVNDRTFKTIVK